jgi:hypothetical protein
MVLCFERGKNVIFWPKKKLKKRHQGATFCSKNLERFRTPTHIKIFSIHML